MNSIWNKNLQAFSARFPSLFSLYSTEIAIVNSDAAKNPAPFINGVELFAAKNGEPGGRENGILLHSSYNPGREAQGAVNQKDVESKSQAAFLGTGLGWSVIEFCRKFPQKKLVIIEPDVLRFFQTLTVLDWTVVFEHQALILAVGCPTDQITGLLEDQSKVNIGNSGISDTYFFDSKAWTNHSAAYFEAVRTIIKRNQRKNDINAATLRKFGKLWCRNSLKNIHQLAVCEPVSIFSSCGLPVLILGAGPSLETILPYLPELKKRMVIVCVETAVRTLLKHSFEPDFIFLTDPQFWAYRHIAGQRAPSSILVTEITAYPAVFRFNCRRIMLCSSQFPIGQYFEKALDYFPGDLGTGGSVASSCWNFAHMLGAREIYTAGLDLSFTKNQTHIKGSSAEQTIHTISSRTKSVQNFTAATIFGADTQKSLNYEGKEVTTDSRMKMFAWWFEARLAACPETKTYSLCSQSLKIPGIGFKKVQEILQLPEITAQKAEILGRRKETVLSENQKNQLEKQIKDFPAPDFLEQYEFLKPYLK